ncbi:MAG: 2-hydroxyacid dehydrogenase [Lachnospiraceae bacterium]|nr:2-hydroxyacid dehydrogenase [Lachnospiraceae bacterium]
MKIERQGMRMKIAFYDTKPYDRIWFEPLAKEKGIEIHFLEAKLNKDTVRLSKDCDAVCIFVNDTADKDVIKALDQYGTRAILLRCAGYNNVDVQAAKNKIHLLRVPSYSPEAVAEYTIGLLLTINRKIHRAYNRTRDFNFSIHGLMGMDLKGKTAGVIGTGKIGQMTIEILKGLKMNILAYDLYPNPSLDVKYVELDELFEQSDVITLHCPLTKETKYLIDKRAIKKMKKDVLLINTSRGGLIQTNDLIEALEQGKFAGVGLDVFEEEEEFFFEDCSDQIITKDAVIKLTSYPNVILTSHQGFFTKEAMKEIAEVTLKNAENLMNNQKNSNGIYENEIKE